MTGEEGQEDKEPETEAQVVDGDAQDDRREEGVESEGRVDAQPWETEVQRSAPTPGTPTAAAMERGMCGRHTAGSCGAFGVAPTPSGGRLDWQRLAEASD